MPYDPYPWLRNLEWLTRLQDSNPAWNLAQQLKPMIAINQSLQPTLSLYDRISQGLVTQFRSLLQNIGSVAEEFHEVYIRVTEFAEMMLEMGWPPPLRLPLSSRSAIREKYSQEGPERTAAFVEEILAEVYDQEELTNLLQAWSSRSYLTRRMRALQEALEAHSAAKYYSSVAILLPAVEGLIADAFVHRGKLNGQQYKGYLETLLGSDDATVYDEFVRMFIMDYILKQFNHGEAQQPGVSRHAILHGADSDYGTRANSLRLIILFDHLQESVNDLQLEQQRQNESE